MNERIKEIRKNVGMTQSEFGKALKMSGSAIGLYEIGARNPTSAVISLICSTFGINEIWLRTGEGEMHSKPAEADVLMQIEKDYAESPVIRSILLTWARMTPAERAAFENIVDKFTEIHRSLSKSNDQIISEITVDRPDDQGTDHGRQGKA